MDKNYKVNPASAAIGIQKDFPKDEFRYKVEKEKPMPQQSKKFSDVLEEKSNSAEEIDMKEYDNRLKTPYRQIEIPKQEDKRHLALRVYGNDDLTATYPGIESSVIKSSKGFFSYCFDDENGLCQEFETLGECRRAARECSRRNPDMEFYIYGMSSMRFVNGKEQ